MQVLSNKRDKKSKKEKEKKEKKSKREKSRSTKSVIVSSPTSRDKDLEQALEEKKKEAAKNLAELESYVKSEQRKRCATLPSVSVCSAPTACSIRAFTRSSSERDIKASALEPKALVRIFNF